MPCGNKVLNTSPSNSNGSRAYLRLFHSLFGSLGFCFGRFLPVVMMAVSLVASCIGIVLIEGAQPLG